MSVISKQHNRKLFDCGTTELNNYLKNTARQHTKRDISRTFVLTEESSPEAIMGFYTITVTEIHAPVDSPLFNYPHKLPAVKIARLAVDTKYQGHGVGGYLIADAMKKVVKAHDIAPVIGIIVDAKNQAAKNFYQSFGFAEADGEDRKFYLWLPMKTIRKTILE